MSLVSRKVIKLSVFLFILNFPFVALSESDFLNNSEVEVLINELVLENGLDRQSLIEIFSKAQLKDSVLKLMTRPAEKIKPWFEYRDIFVSKSRIKNGLLFYQKNVDILTRASKKFGVPPEIIVSIIGVETSYGTNTGGYRVIDALSTLAFHYPSELKNYSKRKTYFTNELIKSFQIVALSIFTVEIIIRFFSYKKISSYFKDPWNIFDLSIIIICYIPESVFSDPETISAIRVLRVFRILRLLSILFLIS